MLATATLPQVNSSADSDRAAVFLASGGARGITAQCVLALARAYPFQWVLLGRSARGEEPVWAKDCTDAAELKKRIVAFLQAKGERPTPKGIEREFKRLQAQREIESTLATLAALDRQALYLSVDVTDENALQQALTAACDRLGPISGILHGAGNLADKLIERKTPQDFARVYEPKVKGLENLLRGIPLQQLDCLLLFSSVAGFYGNAGQADYALANEILNKTAHLVRQQHPRCLVRAINWGPWESGMVTPQLQAVYATRGIETIPVPDGTQMLLGELQRDRAAQVVIGSPIPRMTGSPAGEFRRYRLRRRLSLAANPFLQDHVIGGYPVLPFTCAIGWMASSCEQLYPGYQCFTCRDVRILKGVVFNAELAEEYCVDIEEISKSTEAIALQVKIWSHNTAGKPRYHYSSQIELCKKLPEAPVYPAFNLDPDRQISRSQDNFYQCDEMSLFHGPSFRGIEKVINISQQKITVQCNVRSVSAKNQGQFPRRTIDPFISDAQSHPVWVWLAHYHQSICLPAKIEKFQQYRLTPNDLDFYVTIEIARKTGTSLTFDIISSDERGQIYTHVSQAEATILPIRSITDARPVPTED